MKQPQFYRPQATATFATAIAALLASLAAQAANRTWNGNTDATWNTPANWTEGALGSGNTPVFGAAGSSGTTLTNDVTAGSVAGITFNSGAAAFTIGGNSLALTGNMANNSTSVQTLNTPFSMTAARTFTTTTGGGDLTLGGNISGTGGAITKTGFGTLTLSGANSYTGGTTVSAGTLKIDAGVGGKLYDGQTAGALTLGTAAGGRGTFIYDNTTAADVTALGLGTLTLVAGQGDNTVQLTRTALHATSLTFNSINSVSYPAVNFVISGTPGTIGTDSRIVISGHAAGRMTENYPFLNGGDFAWYDGTGFIRAPKYDGTAAEGSTSAGGTSIAMATHQQLTGSLTAQNSTTPTTLKINGAHDITMATGQTLSFTVDKGALLKTGGGTSTIYGGYSMSVQGSEIIRTDTADDVLVLDSGINSNSSKTRMVKSGEGTLILKGTNQWGNSISGADASVATLYINGGVVEVGGSGVIQNTANKLQLYIANGALFRFNSSGNQLVNRVISGEGSVAMTGAGTLTLSGSNSYSGGTTVSGGILTFLNTSAKTGSTTVAAGATLGLGVGGTGTFTSANVDSLFAGTLAGVTMDAAANVALDTTNGDFTYATSQSAARALVKLGANTLTLTGTNSYSGGTMVSAGTLLAGAPAALPNAGASGTITAGGILAVRAGAATGEWTAADIDSLLANAAFTSSGTGAMGIDTTGGNFSYGTAIVKAAMGMAKQGVNTLTLSGASTYTGATTITKGTLKAGVASVTDTSGAFGLNSAVTMANTAGAAIDITGYNTQIGTLSGGGTTGGNVTLGAATLTIKDTVNATYAGIISGTGGITKSGSGTLALTGANNYSGDTTLTAGTLSINGTWLADTSSVTIAAGAKLVLLTGAGATDTVARLVLDGVTMPAGTYNASTPTYGTYFTGSTGSLVVLAAGYETWATTHGLVAPDDAADADPDHDGLANALEFVLGGEPNPARPNPDSVSLLPKPATNLAGDLVFTFPRTDLSEGSSTVTFQWSTDLSFPSANDVPVSGVDSGGTPGVDVTVDVTEGALETGPDTIVITIPAAKAPGGKVFGRLHVTVP